MPAAFLMPRTPPRLRNQICSPTFPDFPQGLAPLLSLEPPFINLYNAFMFMETWNLICAKLRCQFLIHLSERMALAMIFTNSVN